MPVRGARVAFGFVAIVAALAACGGAGAPGGALLPPSADGSDGSDAKPIKHVVVVIQENRSFDNFFATYPGADGTKVGHAAPMPPIIRKACSPPIVEPTTVPLKQVPLTGGTDLDHVYAGYQLVLDGGKMDGWDLDRSGADGRGSPTCTYAYQYVNPSDIAPYWDIAKQYVLADHTFQTQGSGSFTAHQDLIAGGTDISPAEALIDNPTYFPWGCDANKTVVTAVIKKRTGKVFRFGGPFPCLSYPTMRDLLDAKGISWKFYAVAVQKEQGKNHGDTAGIWSAFDAIKAVRYSREWRTNVTRTNLDFFSDVKNRRLPSVSWITPDGVNSDHPQEKSDTGPSWVASIVNAVGESPYWSSTAIVILWDDWGGFYDHVPPPRPRTWEGGPGFRVPLLVVSPYVRHHVDHTVYQFGSILKFIESLWRLGSLGNNDADSTSLGNAFDFHMAPRKFTPIQAKYSRDFFLHQQPSGHPPDTE